MKVKTKVITFCSHNIFSSWGLNYVLIILFCALETKYLTYFHFGYEKTQRKCKYANNFVYCNRNRLLSANIYVIKNVVIWKKTKVFTYLWKPRICYNRNWYNYYNRVRLYIEHVNIKKIFFENNTPALSSWVSSWSSSAYNFPFLPLKWLLKYDGHFS